VWHTEGGRVSTPGPAASPLERSYYVYILSTPARGLYLGVTNDLARRLFERRMGAPPGSTSPLVAARLVYFEVTSDFRRAFARKEQLEGLNRRRKWRLIESVNPKWRDLAVSGERSEVRGER
jgi:putative endonuclease